jgi:hypothetical protein
MNVSPKVKENFRKPHVMGDIEVREWLELLAEAIY